MNDDAESQADEMTALASIYEEGVFVADGNGGGQFAAHIQQGVPQEFFVKLESSQMIVAAKRFGAKLEGDDGSSLICLGHLPPIVLRFRYPKDYPSKSPPSFTLSCKWLSVAKLSKLCSQMDHIWAENQGEVIIYQWSQFLVEESLQYLGIQSPLSLDFRRVLRSVSVEPHGASSGARPAGSEKALKCVLRSQSHEPSASHKEKRMCPRTEESSKEQEVVEPRAIQDVNSAVALLCTLIEHDRAERKKTFDASINTCLVCYLEKPGTYCISFQGCRHVYCKECVKSYFEVQITEGNVNALNCPHTDCDSPAIPSQVLELVGEELFATYDRLLLQRTLEGMDDVVYCPRLSCQCPVLTDKDSTVAVCTACVFAFCTNCREANHGVNPCKSSEEELKLRMEFDDGDEECRARLKKKYGESLFRDFLETENTRKQNQIKEEIESFRWKEDYSKPCPKCNAPIEKYAGCDVMFCTSPGCGTYFYWTTRRIMSSV